ncbi:MAG: cytochrome d ubiquinol oxidase subunit II [Neisseriaceae bacterium]
MELALVWLIIIGFIIIMYILLDGFTLGVGLLFALIHEDDERTIMLSSILPVWDGNETWLVFAGASLYGGFPLAFSTLFPLWYIPVMLMIFGLLLRGISFEFRLKAKRTKHIWDLCIFSGSLMAIIAQGLIIGSFVSGFYLDPQTQQILPNQPILSWFSFFCSIALVVGYTLLGAARLIKKTRDEFQTKFYNISLKLQWLLMLAIIFVGIYSPDNIRLNMNYWFNLKHTLTMLIFTIIVVILFVIHAIGLKKRIERVPFMSLVTIFIVSYLALIIGKLPYIVPNQLTFMQAKADDGALLFMLIGASILIPILLLYTAYAYKVFGGKVDEKIGY